MTLDHRYQSKPEPTTMYPVEITLNEVRNIFISVWMKYVCESLWGHSLSVTYTQCNNMQARNTCLLFLIPFTWNKVNFPNNLKSWQNHQMQIHSFDQKSDAICLDQNYFQIWIYNTKPLLTINMSSWWVFSVQFCACGGWTPSIQGDLHDDSGGHNSHTHPSQLFLPHNWSQVSQSNTFSKPQGSLNRNL